MKVVILCAVTGNLPVVKECVDTWFPLPENWDIVFYKSKFTYVDGTSEYLEEKRKERGVTIIEDGEHRGHVPALGILFDYVKTKDYQWIVHLDTDAKLLNREFYSWANETLPREKYKVWARNHVRGSSKVDIRHILYLGRAHSWILMVELKFMIDNDLNFDDLRIDGTVSARTNPPKILKSKDVLKAGDKVLVFGDTGWQLYTEASKLCLYQNLPDDVFKMWFHKNNQTENWKAKNIDILKAKFGTKK
jgi:hypothetical protein